MDLMIVTIDGPAGAGKSTVARRLAQRLGFEFLDTGAMYRAVTWAALRDQVDLRDADALVQLTRSLDLKLADDRVWVDGQEVTADIRTAEVTAKVRFIADPPSVREVLVDQQRQLVQDRDVVTEGRDQGTVAFPHAQCKIFLTAAPSTRAVRRWEQLPAEQRPAVDEILAQQNRRDAQDASREVGKLAPAPDAVHVPTDNLTLDQVVDRLVTLVQERQSDSPRPTTP